MKSGMNIFSFILIVFLSIVTACSDSSSGSSGGDSGDDMEVTDSTAASRVYGQGGSFLTNNTSAEGLNMPYSYSVAVDSGGIYISDTYNHRVLYYEGTGTTASRVYGQGGSFTTNIENKGGISADSLSEPRAVAVDTGGVYISDTGNNRVLYYEDESTTAARVYGQGGSFTTDTQNNGGVSTQSLFYPCAIAVDSAGVYIADKYNNRVLYYEGESTTATRVYGQGGVFTTNTSNNGGVSADSLAIPSGVEAGGGGVYIADSGNHRVLYYAGESTTATRVYGQGGIFATNAQNNGGISADSLYEPSCIALDAGGVYIADRQNHRVLYYTGTGTTAARVYGQENFTSNYYSIITTDSLYRPSGVASTASGIYIVDTSNYRVKYYDGTSTTPERVYGQGGNFVSRAINYVPTGPGSLYQPGAVAAGPDGVYIADTLNNRVLYFSATSTSATRVYGQGGDFTGNGAGFGSNRLNHPGGITIDSGGIYIADTNSNRVLYYEGDSTTPVRVYGQNGSFSSHTPNNNGVGAGSLNMPFCIAVSAAGIYIADTYNHRVLYYEGESTTATRVYGQDEDFTTNTVNKGGVSANSLNYPHAVAVDSRGVYIADTYNFRLLYYEGESTTATRVYGQNGSFSTNNQNNGGRSADSLYYIFGVAVDTGGVYIADADNNRVLYYPGTSTTATRVYGQGGSFTDSIINNGGISANCLYMPCGVSSYAGRVYIADTENNRVLFY